jgi:hypothetical protein
VDETIKHLMEDVLVPHEKTEQTQTNTDTLVPSLYQCVETFGIEVFWLLSEPLLRQGHLIGQHLLSNVLERISCASCEPLHATNTSHRKQETFLYEYPFH